MVAVHRDRLAVMLDRLIVAPQGGVAVGQTPMHVRVGNRPQIHRQFRLLDDALVIGGNADLFLVLQILQRLCEHQVYLRFLILGRFFRFQNADKLLPRRVGALQIQIVPCHRDLLIDGCTGARIDEQIPRKNKQGDGNDQKGKLPELGKTTDGLAKGRRARLSHGIPAFLHNRSSVILTDGSRVYPVHRQKQQPLVPIRGKKCNRGDTETRRQTRRKQNAILSKEAFQFSASVSASLCLRG